MRRLRSALTVAFAALSATALAGCFTLRSTITVRPDGSGTLVETLALSGVAAEMGGSEALLSTKATLRARAEALGAGVTFITTDTVGAVRTTTFAFRDVAALRYGLPTNASEAESVARTAEAEPLYTFAFEPASGPGGAATLRVVVPVPDDAGGAGGAPVDSAAARQAREGIALARALFGEARATVDLVVAGEIDQTDVPLVDGRATLFDVSFGALFDLVEAHPELATRQAPPFEEIMGLAEGYEGLTFQLPGTYAVRFH